MPLVVLISDTHAGSRLAVASPDTRLPDPNTGDLKPITLTPIQKKMAAWWAEDLAWVKAKANGAGVTVIHVGDLIQGTRFPSELVSTSLADQVLMGLDLMRPWAALAERYIQVAGTEVHEAGESSAAVLITEALRREFPRLEITLAMHPLVTIGHELFDLAHHGPPPGGRAWLRGNVLRLATLSALSEDAAAGLPLPTVMVRGHYHVYTREYVSYGQHHMTRSYILPSWQWPNPHAIKAARSPSRAAFGILALDMHEGRIVHEYARIRTVDLRHRIVTEVDDHATSSEY